MQKTPMELVTVNTPDISCLTHFALLMD